MLRIGQIILVLHFVSSSGFAAHVVEKSDAARRDYEARYTPGPKNNPLEVPIVTFVYSGSNRVEKVALSEEIDTIDEVHYARDRCIILGTLNWHAGSNVSIVDAKLAKVVASIQCFFPVVSPNGANVVFEKWNATFAPRENLWPAVLVISTIHAEGGPVQVYPDEESNPGDPLGDNHLVVSPKIWSSDGGVLAFLDKFGDYGNWKAPYEIYAVVVRFKDGKPLRAKRALIQKETFVRPGANPEYIGFGAESLEISDGKLRGKLHPEDYWVRDTFSFDLARIDKELPLGIGEVKADAAGVERK